MPYSRRGLLDVTCIFLILSSQIYDGNLAKRLRVMSTATFCGGPDLGIVGNRNALVFHCSGLVRAGTEVGVGDSALPILHVTCVWTPAVYESIIDWVSQETLAGDRDAAEWIILCSVARVYEPHLSSPEFDS